MRERPPAWLRRIAPRGNPFRLVPARCECGAWVISQRDGVWTDWDPNVVEGDDITAAVILDIPLVRIDWNRSLEYARLYTVFNTHGLDPDGQYLALHECGRPPISDRRFDPPPPPPEPPPFWEDSPSQGQLDLDLPG